MAQKQQRWYEVDEDGVTVRVYDAPKPELATSVSIVGKADLVYYRRTFKLSKIWE